MTTVALAGRRPDPPGADPPRFPLANRHRVAERLARYFRDNDVRRLVCSAACGADLLALEAAGATGSVARTVVLPFDVATFRRISVADRPGDWGALFDGLIASVTAEGGLRLLEPAQEEAAAFRAATDAIVAEAARSPAPHRVCIVWEGSARAGGDNTEALSEAGRDRGWPVDEIPTMS